jgi:hypothetical protein
MELLAGYFMGKVVNVKNQYILYDKSVMRFTGIIAECKTEEEAIEIFNDHIPLLEGLLLNEPVVIKKN